MSLFGFSLSSIPLWALFVIALIVVFILWKFLKFAMIILVIIIVFFAILIGFDLLGVFSWIKDNILSLFM